MLTFPPARLPSDPSWRLEPHTLPLAYTCVAGDGIAPRRADRVLYIAGLNALVGRPFMTSDGVMLQVLDCAMGKDSWEADWFEWDGKKRRIHMLRDRAGQSRLLVMLADAWAYEGAGDDEHLVAFQAHLAKALAYRRMDDAELIAMNFDLLVASTERILSTPRLRDGDLGGLSAVFVYMGLKRYSVSTLLELWRAGRLRVQCPDGPHVESAYVIRGGGGLSMGEVEAYCPACRSVKRFNAGFISYFKAICNVAVRGNDGYRLDEIIDELGGALPSYDGL